MFLKLNRGIGQSNSSRLREKAMPSISLFSKNKFKSHPMMYLNIWGLLINLRAMYDLKCIIDRYLGFIQVNYFSYLDINEEAN